MKLAYIKIYAGYRFKLNDFPSCSIIQNEF